MSDRQGADARRDATSGQFVCFCWPGAGALDRTIVVLDLRPPAAHDSWEGRTPPGSRCPFHFPRGRPAVVLKRTRGGRD